MSALRELDLSSLEKEAEQAFLRQAISTLFWGWFESNRDRKVTTINWWFIRKTLYVRDLFGVFEILFGPNPNGQTA
jgi:hypothetical protein